MGRYTIFVLCTMLALVTGPSKAQAPDLKEQVTVALNKAKKLDLSQTRALSERGDAVLPYLQPYASDPDPFVRHAVVDAAGGIHTPRARSMVASFVADKEQSVGREAIDLLDQYSSRRQVMTEGGQALKQSLMLHVKQDATYSAGIFLLGYFSDDPNVVQFLQGLGAAHPDSKAQIQGGQPAKLSICIDLALSETGQSEAVDRVLQDIENGSPDDLLFITNALKYTNDQGILVSLMQRLQDKRETSQIIGPLAQVPKGSPPLPPNPHLRVCDAALVAVAKKTRVPVGIADVDSAVQTNPLILPPRNYTDDELAQAYSRFAAYNQSLAP